MIIKVLKVKVRANIHIHIYVQSFIMSDAANRTDINNSSALHMCCYQFVFNTIIEIVGYRKFISSSCSCEFN